MNAHPRLSPALSLTVTALQAAVTSATFPDTPKHRWVENADTGEHVGWLRTWQDSEGSAVEWQHIGGYRRGYADTEENALAALSVAVMELRQLRKPEPAHDGIDHRGGRFLDIPS